MPVDSYDYPVARSTEVTIQPGGGEVIQRSFAGGDAAVLRFVSGYLFQ